MHLAWRGLWRMAPAAHATQWRSIAASCAVGILVGAATMNWAIVGQIAETRTLTIGLRRDLDLHRDDFRSEQRRTDERLAKQSETVQKFMELLREQNILLKQMMDQRKP